MSQPYLVYNEQQLENDTENSICDLYDQGYLFTRKQKGLLYQTRALRINLSGFVFNSENRRVQRKTEDMQMLVIDLPLSEADYDWQIHKLGKDFYTRKFGEGTFSAAKIRELVSNSEKSNFNKLLSFGNPGNQVGYCILYQNSELLHYSYPFYDLDKFAVNYGMGMILDAIEYSINSRCKYFYLGSASRPEDKYKIQFQNLEWFDIELGSWNRDLEKLKSLVA